MTNFATFGEKRVKILKSRAEVHEFHTFHAKSSKFCLQNWWKWWNWWQRSCFVCAKILIPPPIHQHQLQHPKQPSKQTTRVCWFLYHFMSYDYLSVPAPILPRSSMYLLGTVWDGYLACGDWDGHRRDIPETLFHIECVQSMDVIGVILHVCLNYSICFPVTSGCS